LKNSANPRNSKRIAYFVSPHGLGHAARAAAVMEAAGRMDDTVHFDIFTTVPAWFFADSLKAAGFTYHKLTTDLGLVQKSAFEVDLDETLRRLNGFLPFSPARIADAAAALRALHCSLVICEIAPLGIPAAAKAGVASVLIENFTWDWIYRQYVDRAGGLAAHIAYLQGVFSRASYHIQTAPVCRSSAADLTTPPVCRRARLPADLIRNRLGIPADYKMVVLTTGGIPPAYGFIDRLYEISQTFFVLPGAGVQMQTRGNVIILPHRSDFFHPDLINAADAVVGKLGYSTLAEVFEAGVPFGYVGRADFRESERLAAFAQKHMPAMALEEAEFFSGTWVAKLDALLSLPRAGPGAANGAGQIGRFLLNLLP